MRHLKLFGLIAAVTLLCIAQVGAQGLGLGTRIANLPVFQRGSREEARSSTPRSTREGNTAATSPVPPRQSELTFPRSPLAPEPSVTIPAATSPTGNLNSAASNDTFQFGSRLRMAANAARERLTIKPRIIPADDPIKLDSTPKQVDAPIYVAAARVFEGQGRMDKAREQYEKALAVDAKDLDALVGFARLQHREGDLVAATELYQRAIKAHPNNPVALNDLGLCYARRGILPQAEQSLRQAVKRDSRSKLYRNNLALVLVEMNETDEALRQLNAVHGPAVSEYNLAYMLKEKGRPEEAAHHLQSALRRDPQLEAARQLLASLQPAQHSGGREQAGQRRFDTAYRSTTTVDRSADRVSSPVRLRIGDSGNSNNSANPQHSAGGQSAQPLLRRAPVPGDLPDYMRRAPSP